MPTFCAPHQSRNISMLHERYWCRSWNILFNCIIYTYFYVAFNLLRPILVCGEVVTSGPDQQLETLRLPCVWFIIHAHIPDHSAPYKHPSFLLPLRCDWSYKTLCIWTLPRLWALGAGTLLLIKQTRAPALQLRLMAVLAIADQAFYLCLNTLSKMTFLEDFHEIHWHKNIKIKGH